MGRQSGNGLASIQAARTETHQAGVMAGDALIPLIGNNSQFDLLHSQSIYLYIYNDSWDYTSESLFRFLLFTLTYNPDGLYSNNPPLNPKGC